MNKKNEKKNLKKFLTIFFISIISVVLIWFVIYLIDYLRFKNNGSKPFITFKTNNYIYFDGNVTEYIGLGYKMIDYNRKSIKEKSFKSITSKIENLVDSIVIIDNTSDVCAEEIYYFYEDENNKYYFNCKKEYEIKIDGKKYKLEDTLKNNLIKVDELFNYLEFKIEEK